MLSSQTRLNGSKGGSRNGGALNGTRSERPQRSTVAESQTLPVCFPTELHGWATEIARSADESLAEFVVRAVEREVDRRILRGGPEFVANLEKLRVNGDGPESNGQTPDRSRGRRPRVSPA